MSRHVPVLLKEVIDNLQLKSGSKVIDCTLGDAGHSEAILDQIGPKGKLLGIDADPESLLRAKKFLDKFGKQVVFVRDNFVNLKEIVSVNDFKNVDAVLLDLGWSTPQFKERGRGFSFENNEPLDMRYNGVSGESATDIINEYTEKELEKILRYYGEENLSREIAKDIVGTRVVNKIDHTAPLVEIILGVYRRKLKTDKEVPWIGGIHPATKVFQALRIAVNKELTVVQQVLPQAVELLSSGGRLAVISFHSLEDRIVKQFFVKNQNKTIRVINKKPIVASEKELINNPSSRSAKLRIIEKI